VNPCPTGAVAALVGAAPATCTTIVLETSSALAPATNRRLSGNP